MTKVSEFRILLRERPDGFIPITGIIDAKQIDFPSRESISHESSDLQRLISRGKMSKDGLRVVLLENGRFYFFKGVALQGFLSPNRASNQTFRR